MCAQLCPTLCEPMDCSLLRLLCPWDFSKQESWSGLPFPSSGDLPDAGFEPVSPTLQVNSLPLSHQVGYLLSIDHIHLFTECIELIIIGSTYCFPGHRPRIAHLVPTKNLRGG